jgi:hypothetical protein
LFGIKIFPRFIERPAEDAQQAQTLGHPYEVTTKLTRELKQPGADLEPGDADPASKN